MKQKDKLLLLELLKNGRQNFSKLGRKFNMSRQAVFSRVKTLKNQGIIRNFTVDIDHEKIGINLRAYILMIIQPGKNAREKINKFFKECKQISQVHNLFGTYDFLLEVLVRDRAELTQLISKMHEFDSVRKTKTLIVYNTIKNDQSQPVEEILSDQNIQPK